MATYSWKNAGSGNWNTNGAWSIAGFPNSTTADVFISVTGTYAVNEDINGTIRSLTIADPNATLGFAAGASLAVTNAFTNDGTITIGAGEALTSKTLNNSGIVLLQGGTLNSTTTTKNTGLIEGFGTITGPVTGSGLIEAVGGTLEITSPITSGAPAFQIDNGATLKLDGAESSAITFAFKGGSGVLDIGTTFKGAVSGMTVGTSSTVPTTAIDVQSIVSSATLIGTHVTLSTGQVLTLANSFPSNTAAYVAPDLVLGGTDIFFAAAPCFAAGTRILTPDGEQTVETLAAGDQVVVVANDGRAAVPIKWVGQRRVDLAMHPRPDLAAPIRIRRDAIKSGQPVRDVLVSPDHCLFIDDCLIPAMMLVNDMTIMQEIGRADVHYLHVELDRHAILVADGLLAESYLDTGNRAMFANAGVAMLHPAFQVNQSLRTWQDDACARLAVDPVTLAPIWRRLASRAKELGFQVAELMLADDPDLRIIVSGAVIEPLESCSDRAVFLLPRGTERVVLSSRATRSADVVRYLDDRRALGVAVGSVTLTIGSDRTVYPADHLPVGSGWHAHEAEPGAIRRWTNGAGELVLERLTAPGILEVRLAGATRYIVGTDPVRQAA